MQTQAGDRWRQQLALWAIPDAILEQAEDDPWALPVEHFAPDPLAEPTPSHRRAREALPEGGTVLDVGAGGGAMSGPLRDHASRIVAVDRSQAMLDSCAADERILGLWPEVAPRTPRCDVAVCGHVVYNVPGLEDFLLALTGAAHRRVVVELTAEHPRGEDWERDLWRRFWDLERPHGPTAEDAVAVARSVGLEPRSERWERDHHHHAHGLDELVAVARRRLCLPAGRDAEVRAALTEAAAERDGGWVFSPVPREVVTLWWDGVDAGDG